MTDRELMQQVLDDICAAKLCEFNSMSSRHEMIWLMDKAIAALRERLAQPWEKFCDSHCTAFDHHPDCKLSQPEQEHIIDCPRCGHCCPQQPEQNRAEKMRDAGYTRRPTLREIASEDEQPVQEPSAWRNAALRVGEDLCSVGPFGYYDMTAEQWLDWALSVVTVHAPPASKPHGFAGVTAWIGDATVTRIVTQVQIQHERVAGQSMKQTAQVCLDMLAAHGITGEKK